VNEIALFSSVAVISVFIAACSQILLKKASSREYRSKIYEYLNMRVIVAYGLFFVSASMGMYVLRHIPISLAAVLGAAGYMFVPILSRYFLKERLNKNQIMGMVMIILGIIIFVI